MLEQIYIYVMRVVRDLDLLDLQARANVSSLPPLYSLLFLLLLLF